MLDTSNVAITETTCAYCGVGCGVAVKQERHTEAVIDVSGDVNHPANGGRLCIKGANLGRTLSDKERLLTPLVDGEQASFSHAFEQVAQRLQQVIDEHGPESVGFYLSGQLLTEDYYVANKFCKGFIGSPHLDTNSRLCMSSAVVAHQRAFGEDLVPGNYDDLEQADLVLLVGSNMSWTHPIVFQRLLQAKEANPQMQIVVLDPKRTATAQLVDLHLPLAPASDGFFFTGLLAYLAQSGALDQAYIDAHTQGFAHTLAAAEEATPDIQSVARLCDLSPSLVAKVFAAFANTKKVVTVFSQGINQSNTGTDKASAIINCHLATGKIGRPGASPFSITGQPNAMGGREVGGLATQVAAHRSYQSSEEIASVEAFWQAPNMVSNAGHKAVDLFDAVADGRIKAIWIMATNPVVSMPEADKVRQALLDCPLVIVSDSQGRTDTSACADIVIPCCGWGEKDGTVTNSERMISRQRAFMDAPQGIQQDWQVVAEIAQRMGYGDAFDYASSADIFREHAALSVLDDGLAAAPRVFNLGPLATLTDEQFDTLQPVQWPVVTDSSAADGWTGTPRLFTDQQFATATGKAQFYAVQPALAAGSSSSDYPLWLNTGRLRDQWHTMTRTGMVSQLSRHEPEPRLEIHPFDAKAYGLEEQKFVLISSAQGDYTARVHTSESLRQGQVFLPIHWSDQYASQARVSSLLPSVVDPHSGQPQYKQTAVKVAPLKVKWQARLVCASNVNMQAHSIWHRQSIQNAWHWQMAGQTPVAWQTWLKEVLPEHDDYMQLQGSHGHSLRVAAYLRGQLIAVLWVAESLPEVDLELIQPLLFADKLNSRQRLLALAGRQGMGMQMDKLICSCLQVTASQIDQAIAKGSDSLAALKQSLGCGSGCGSCLGDVQAQLHKAVV